VWLDRVSYGPTPSLQSKRLLRPAALVKAPVGEGFVLLDQVRWDSGSNAEKASRYLANLLTNLGAEFQTAAGALRIPGSGLTSAKPGRYTPDQEGAMRIGSNGTVLATVRFAQSRKYRFTIRARGTEAAGEFPNIDVSLDGRRVGNVMLSRPDWQLLHLEVDVPAGEHQIGLTFTNDFYDPPKDRNLVISEVQIR